MNPKISLVVIIVTLGVLALACGQGTNQPQVDPQAVENSVAATEAASATLTAAAAPPPTATTAAATPTTDPDTVFAPDPLTPGYTGLIFDAGGCYDFDTLQPVPANDSARDICMIQFGLLEPQNGGLMSGYAPLNPPSKGYCINPNLLPDPIAVQTDLYLCFQTNDGVYGYFVARNYQIDQDRVIFDMYLFP